LDLDGALGRVDHARELGQDAVASGVDDAAVVPADQRQDHCLMSLEVADCLGLVLAHKAAVAGDVGGENSREPALHRGIVVDHLFSRAAEARVVSRLMWKMQDAASGLRPDSMLPSMCCIIQ